MFTFTKVMSFVLQLRSLVVACINPDPNMRPDIERIHEVATRMHELTMQQQQ